MKAPDDAVRYGQSKTKPGAGALGREERLEDSGNDILGDAWPAVAHRDPGTLADDIDLHLDGGCFGAIDRIQRITKQIDEHLLEAYAIAPRLRVLPAEQLGQLDALRLEAVLKQQQGILNASLDEDLPGWISGLVRECLELPTHVGHAVDNSGD